MSTLTCPHLALSLHPHAPHRHAPRPLHVAGPSSPRAPCRRAPRRCTHHVAVPLAAACTASPCSLRRLICLYAFPFSFYYYLFCSPIAVPQWHDGDVAART